MSACSGAAGAVGMQKALFAAAAVAAATIAAARLLSEC